MKKRNIMLGSAILLAVLLVAGGTMAWFTADANITNSFKAGTVKIEINGQSETVVENVNPGDSYDNEVSVKNAGSKRAYMRVELVPKFVGVEGNTLSAEGIVTYPILANWVLHTDGWYYYKNIVQPGASTTNLIEEVLFAGAGMGNEYQGAEFTLTVNAQAIQATNGAINDEWGVNPAVLGLEVLPVTP